MAAGVVQPARVSEGLLAGAVFAGLRIERLVASGGIGLGLSRRRSDAPPPRRPEGRGRGPGRGCRLPRPVPGRGPARGRPRALRRSSRCTPAGEARAGSTWRCGTSTAARWVHRLDGERAPRCRLRRSASCDRSRTPSMPPTRAGLVHRDVKPAQHPAPRPIRLRWPTSGWRCRPRLARRSRQRRRAAGRAGTIGYLAPEQIEGDRGTAPRPTSTPSPASLFECLSGQQTLPARQPARGDLRPPAGASAEPGTAAAGAATRQSTPYCRAALPSGRRSGSRPVASWSRRSPRPAAPHSPTP